MFSGVTVGCVGAWQLPRMPAAVTPEDEMPIAAPRPCSHPGCGALVRDGTGRCPKHPKKAWAAPAKETKRITGRRLQAMRADLFRRKPLCEPCQEAGRVTLATIQIGRASCRETV